MASSVSHVEGWIQAEVHRGADPRRIILMGFSQGAALGLLVALTTLHDLGGVVSLAGWIPHKGREVSSHQAMPMQNTKTITRSKSSTQDHTYQSSAGTVGTMS
jgi:predicted esterase